MKAQCLMTKVIYFYCFCSACFANPNFQDNKKGNISTLVFLGAWFGDAYFPLKQEIDRRGWTMKIVGVDIEYRGCYNKKRDVVLRSDILIPDLKDFSGFDCLIIPSGPQWQKFNQNPQVLQFIRDAHAAGVLIASFCVGNRTVMADGLVDASDKPNLEPAEFKLVKERILLGPRGGGPPQGDGIKSAPIKELCDAIDRELKNKKGINKISILEGPYLGQKTPGMTPEIFASGIISTGLDELNSVFSADGTEFYFCVRRPGALSIFQIKLGNGIWSKPALLPFASRFGDIDISLSPDGNKLFFSSKRLVSENTDPKSDYDFWMVDRVGHAWGKPIHLGPEINSDRDDFYPMMTNDGTLYFSSQREGPGTNNIYRSRLVNGHYLAAEKLDSSINSAYRDFDPYISPDESLLIFASVRPGGFGTEDLYISYRKADGSWTLAKNMGDKINSPGAEYCPMLSPDGKFLFFTGARRAPIPFPDQPLSYHEFESYHNLPQNVFSDIYWVDAKIIKDLKLKELG